MRLALRLVPRGAVTAVACLLAACGSSSSPRLSAAAAERMNQALADTRAAADAHDKEKAIDALGALAGIVGRESRAGHLSAADERALRTGIAQARRRVELDVKAPQPPPPPPPPPQPIPQDPPAEKEDDEDEDEDGDDEGDRQGKPDKPGKSRGKGKGRD